MNLKQHRFVTEYLRHRDAMTAYSIAYNYETSNYASLQSAANRLMNHPEVSAAIHSILDSIRHDVEQEIRAELKVELLTIQYKRELLAKIATGQAYAVQNYKGKDCNVCTQFVYPTINQMLKAIDLDNKLAGHYSVDKRQVSPYPPKGEIKTTIAQQNTTTELSSAGGGVSLRLTGVEHSRRTENTKEQQQLSEAVSLQPLKETSKSQQITTIELSPAGGGVSLRLTGVEHSRKTENAIESQQLSEAVSLQPLKETSKSQQNTTIHLDTKAPLRVGGNTKTPSLIAEKGPRNINPDSQSFGKGQGEVANSAYPPYQQGSPIRQTVQTLHNPGQ